MSTTNLTSTGLTGRPDLAGGIPGLPAGANVQYQVGYASEDPRVAAYKVGLLEEARNLYNQPLAVPSFEAAGPSAGQIQAADLARQGIGAYTDYLNQGYASVGQGQGLTQAGARLAGDLDVAPEYREARNAMQAGLDATGQLSKYSTLAGEGLDEVRSGIGGLQYARGMAPNYMQAGLGSSNTAINQALGIMQGAGGQSDFTREYGILSGAQGTAQQAANEAAQAARLGPAPTAQYARLGPAPTVEAAQLGPAPTAEAARMGPTAAVQAERVGQGIGSLQAAQSDFRPNLQTFQMGPAQQVASQQIGIRDLTGAQTSFRPNLQTFQMGPAQQITTQSFGAPGTAESMMSPYMQNVVDIQQREALRQDAIAKQGRAAQAVRAGAFGGTREGVVEAEAQRNLDTRLGDIQAQGLQQAYQQAQQQFNTEQQARLGAQQANQAAGLTVGQQNLAAQLGVQALGEGQIGLQTALANLSNEQQARVQSEANRLQASGMNQQIALQAALANQQAGLTVGQQNLAAQLGVQQLGTQTGMQMALANLSNEQQARVQNQANLLQSQGMNQTAALQAALSNQQIDYNTGLQNAQMLQQVNLANQALQGQYGIQGAQLQQQANLANQAMQGQYGLLDAQLQQQINLANQAMQGQYGIQGAQLGLQAAAQRFQQAGFDANTAMQMAQLDQTQQQQTLQQAQAIQGIGALRGQQALQQAQVGQAGTQLYGSLAAQEAQLGGMLPAQIAQAQAGIDAQRAGLYNTLGLGVGNLAAQRAGIDLQRAGSLNQAGAQMAQTGMQQASLGQAAQQMGQADVNMMMGIGAVEQANEQAQIDAIRSTTMAETMAPYQQLAFVSDMYRGAPSTQSSLIGTSQPSASPFQTAAGLGIAGVSAAAGAKKVGLL